MLPWENKLETLFDEKIDNLEGQLTCLKKTASKVNDKELAEAITDTMCQYFHRCSTSGTFLPVRQKNGISHRKLLTFSMG